MRAMRNSLPHLIFPSLLSTLLAVSLASPVAASPVAASPVAIAQEPALPADAAEALAEEALTDPTAAEEEPAEPDWKGELGLSYLSVSGNSETESLGLEFDLQRRPEPWGLVLRARFQRTEENGEETAERYFTSLRGERSLSEPWSLFAGVNAERDEYAGFDLRSVVEAGSLYKLLTGPVHELIFELGATFTEEDFVDRTETSYLGALAGFAYVWHVNEGTKFIQRAVYHPNFDNSDDWRLTAETALTTSLTQRLALKLGYQLRYDNHPADQAEKRDTTTTASLVVNF